MRLSKTVLWSGALVGLAFSLAPALGQGLPVAPAPSWLDPTLLAAARAEGGLVVYSSTNEREGLPLWKMFEDTTGIKVHYVRASDSALMSRIVIEFRADQKSYDTIHTSTVNKVPPQLLETYEPPEAKHLFPEARDPNGKWYGVYANYNTPSYNTRQVKASELPKTYEEFLQHKEWAGQVAIDGTDNEWLKAILLHYGEERGTQLIKDLVATLKPVVTDGHLALARSVGSGEYWIALNNYVNLTLNVKLSGAPSDFWALDPVTLIFGQVGISAKAPHPNAARLAANFILSKEAQKFQTQFGRLPTRPDVSDNPPGTVEALKKKKVTMVLITPEEERKWQRLFESLFRPR
jgi:iron(III) transport system substrate-binding protein